MKKKIIVSFLVFVSFSSDVFANNIVNGWINESNYTYYYKNGIIQKGITEIEGTKYFLGENTGRLIKGWVNADDGYTYYMDNNGIVQTGITEIEGIKYFLGENTGRLIKGWVNADDGYTYYMDSRGVVQTGKLMLNGNMYFLDENTGRLIKGWINADDGYTYYMNNNGIVQKGITEIEGIKYFLGENTGRLIKGWVNADDGYTYYMDSRGVVQKGITEIEGTKYFLGENTGRLIKGWVHADDGYTYYMDNNGIVQKGITEIEGIKYFLGENTGRLIKGWVHADDGYVYYTDSQGEYKTWFEDAIIINRYMPSELLPYCFDNKFEKGITNWSTSVFSLEGLLKKIINYDKRIDNTFKQMDKYYAVCLLLKELKNTVKKVYLCNINDIQLLNLLDEYFGNHNKYFDIEVSDNVSFDEEDGVIYIIDHYNYSYSEKKCKIISLNYDNGYLKSAKKIRLEKNYNDFIEMEFVGLYNFNFDFKLNHSKYLKYSKYHLNLNVENHEDYVLEYINYLSKLNKDKSLKIEKLEEENNNYKKEEIFNKKLNNEIINLRNSLTLIREENNRLINSTSWRITKPYRWVGRIVKKVINK